MADLSPQLASEAPAVASSAGRLRQKNQKRQENKKMNYEEKENILKYLENEGLRLHTELENAKRSYYTDRSIFACMALLRAQIAYSSFKKFSHDIYTLMENPF